MHPTTNFVSISAFLCAIALNAAAADAPASAKMDPCTLVSQAEARSILGVEVTAPASSDDGLMRHCVYSSADKSNILMLEAKSTDKALFERWMKLHGTPVPKLGSDAYVNGGVLLIWKNGTQVDIKIDDHSRKASEEQIEAAQERIAALVLSRL
jgi:hypothetical protein